MTEKKELILTARTTFVVEMSHPSAWDTKCQAEQVFEAGDRENRHALEQIIIDQAKTNMGREIRIISSNTSVVILSKAK